MTMRTMIGMAFLMLFAACAEVEEPAVQNPQMDIPEEYKIGGLAVGLQAYTFNRYSVMEAIEKTYRAGGRVIELYPGQRLSPDQPDVYLDVDASDEVIDMVLARLDEFDIIPLNFGVVRIPNEEAGARQVFEFAQKLGIQAISTESVETLDLIEPLVDEFDIMIAIHNHPKGWGPEGYQLWDPEYVLSLVEGRDPRIGASADVGHWVRSNIVPVEGLRTLQGRLVSVHFSDVGEFGPDGEDIIAGKGVADVPAILDELRRQNFGGHISIEYETNWFENVTDVAQIIGFIRGWAVMSE
ncbi:TIM barrel protein [Balneolaceae bacterium ANBcel3]|nr:TIM barrel protein [Balneolaceae bacterium ANBcel3]